MGERILKYTEHRYPFPLEEADADRTPAPGEMWVLIEDGKVVAVDFLCPCGCGSECYTPTGMPSPRHWEYEKGPNGPTLKPSIRFTSGCKAHFHITDGKTKFCGDSGR